MGWLGKSSHPPCLRSLFPLDALPMPEPVNPLVPLQPSERPMEPPDEVRPQALSVAGRPLSCIAYTASSSAVTPRSRASRMPWIAGSSPARTGGGVIPFDTNAP